MVVVFVLKKRRKNTHFLWCLLQATLAGHGLCQHVAASALPSWRVGGFYICLGPGISVWVVCTQERRRRACDVSRRFSAWWKASQSGKGCNGCGFMMFYDVLWCFMMFYALLNGNMNLQVCSFIVKLPTERNFVLGDLLIWYSSVLERLRNFRTARQIINFSTEEQMGSY